MSKKLTIMEESDPITKDMAEIKDIITGATEITATEHWSVLVPDRVTAKIKAL